MGNHAAPVHPEDRLMARTVAAFQSFCKTWNEVAVADFQVDHDEHPEAWHRPGLACRWCP